MNLASVIPATRISLLGPQNFTYSVPDELTSRLRVGMIVKIPFGKRELSGVVLEIGKSPESLKNVKPILSIVWEKEIVSPQLFRLAKFISEYYIVSKGLVIKAMITKPAPRAKLQQKHKVAHITDPKFTLNQEQDLAVKKIMQGLNKHRVFLLHGVTGSGKTEVYIRVMNKLLQKHKQVLMLVPEIALTPQTFERFSTRFSEKIIDVVHSKVSYGQKAVIWERIFTGKSKILIGPRSALFAPFSNLGAIIMDEEHDSSYKQFDQNPKFHAREVALQLSKEWDCPLILGDATPSLETYYAGQNLNFNYLVLSRRIHQELPRVDLVDMREEAREGNFSIFSEKLLAMVRLTLEQKQQTILFINRRGTATSMICRDCGEIIMCQRCFVTVVYHKNKNRLICHHCNCSYEIPKSCSKCQSHRLKLIGTGTEKVEEQIQKHFPKARIRRLDRDLVRTKKDYEGLYQDFISGRFDILVGTQMLARGWDLSTVGLIGIVNSDTNLQLPDFRSNERTFQLITQVAGRTGRGKFPGRVILQTYNPENFAIQAAVKHDYEQFYGKEIMDRKKFFYPPFSKLIKLTYKHSRLEKAQDQSKMVADKLRQIIPYHLILGPAPAFIPRIRRRYIFYVILKLLLDKNFEKTFEKVRYVLKNLSAGFDIDVDPENLL